MQAYKIFNFCTPTLPVFSQMSSKYMLLHRVLEIGWDKSLSLLLKPLWSFALPGQNEILACKSICSPCLLRRCSAPRALKSEDHQVLPLPTIWSWAQDLVSEALFSHLWNRGYNNSSTGQFWGLKEKMSTVTTNIYAVDCNKYLININYYFPTSTSSQPFFFFFLSLWQKHVKIMLYVSNCYFLRNTKQGTRMTNKSEKYCNMWCGLTFRYSSASLLPSTFFTLGEKY